MQAMVLVGLLLPLVGGNPSPLAEGEMQPDTRPLSALGESEQKSRAHLRKLYDEMRQEGDPVLRDLQEREDVLGRNIGGYVEERWVWTRVESTLGLSLAVPLVLCLSPCALVTLPCGALIGGSVAGASTGPLAGFPVLIGAMLGACWPCVLGNVVKGQFADLERREALAKLREKARSVEEAPLEDEVPAELYVGHTGEPRSVMRY